MKDLNQPNTSDLTNKHKDKPKQDVINKAIDRNSRILVTGATGFLGSHIIKTMLDEGYHNITAIHRTTSEFDLIEDIKNKITWVEASLSDLVVLDDLLDKIDVVIHAAAMVSFHPPTYERMHEVNVNGTATLVNLAISNDVSHFVYISSVAALGRKNSGELIDETADWEDSPFNSQYGKSKHLGELEVWRGQAEGLNVTVLNPSYIIGVGLWDEGPTSLFKKIYDGMPFYPTGRNGIVDVWDVSKMVEIVISQRIYNERIIVCAESMWHKDFFTKIADAFTKKPPHMPLNKWIIALGWRLEAVKSFFLRKTPILTKETVSIAQLDFQYDNTKSKSIANFQYRDATGSINDICNAYSSRIKS